MTAPLSPSASARHRFGVFCTNTLVKKPGKPQWYTFVSKCFVGARAIFRKYHRSCGSQVPSSHGFGRATYVTEESTPHVTSKPRKQVAKQLLSSARSGDACSLMFRCRHYFSTPAYPCPWRKESITRSVPECVKRRKSRSQTNFAQHGFWKIPDKLVGRYNGERTNHFSRPTS